MSVYLHHTENELLELLKNSDEAAFTTIYRRHSERLYLNLLKLVKSPEIAEEMLQEIFMKVWMKREEMDIKVGFYPYLYQIGKNMILDFFKKAARDKALLNQLALGVLQAEAEDPEAASGKEGILSKALEQLPPQRRQVFYLCKIEGKSYQEVGSMLQISVSTVSDHIVKATKSIHAFINNHGSEVAVSVAMLVLLDGIR